MEFNEDDFFRNATLQICSSLDIEKALFNCLQYIRLFLPASTVGLGLYEQGIGNIACLFVVDRLGNRRSSPSIPVTKESMQELQSLVDEAGIGIIDRLNETVAGVLRPYIDVAKHAAILMGLSIEGRHIGSFFVFAEGTARFTSEHVRMVSVLREPLSIAMSNALRYKELEKLKDILDAENRELSRELRGLPGGEIIGGRHGMKRTMQMVRQVAPLDSPVLLLGETGVGKEVVADVIHHSSPRRGGPFIKVNCGAIPENLMDSELFGHEKGAFTGAVARKMGRFERANAGTILLDEIGELPLQAQVRLLRVLQQKEIERVGGAKTIAVDVRVIAATHRDMEELVRSGAFREDLWFRLNVFPIRIPPLRDRKEDISALVNHFIERKSKELKIFPVPSVSAEVLERLKAYHWPGNVRELENMIERELIYFRGIGTEGRLLQFENLNTCIQGTTRPNETSQAFLPLEKAESHHIITALRSCAGRISGPKGAAQLLEINPNTLRSRMKKLGIPFSRNGGE